MRILENLSARTMQRINWGLFSRAHCNTRRAQENGKGGNEAFPIQRGTCTQSAVYTHTHTHWNTVCLWPLAAVILLLKVSLHLIHNGPPCLLMLWCFFKKQTPIKSSGVNSQPRGSFLRLCGFWRDRRQVGKQDDITSGAAWEEGNQRRPSRDSYLHHNSVFLYSYFMCYPGMKGTFFSLSLHGGGAGYGRLSGHTPHNKMRRRRRLGGVVRGIFFGFKASKQPAQTEKKYFPRERAAQSCVVIQNM